MIINIKFLFSMKRFVVLLFGALFMTTCVFTSCDKDEDVVQTSSKEVAKLDNTSTRSSFRSSRGQFGTLLVDNLSSSRKQTLTLYPYQSYYVRVRGNRVYPLWFYVKNENRGRVLVRAYQGSDSEGYDNVRTQDVGPNYGTLFTLAGRDLYKSRKYLIIQIENPTNETISNVIWHANFTD